MQTMFRRRSFGVDKKARELAINCGATVVTLVQDENGTFYQFHCGPVPLEKMLQKALGNGKREIRNEEELKDKGPARRTNRGRKKGTKNKPKASSSAAASKKREKEPEVEPVQPVNAEKPAETCNESTEEFPYRPLTLEDFASPETPEDQKEPPQTVECDVGGYDSMVDPPLYDMYQSDETPPFTIEWVVNSNPLMTLASAACMQASAEPEPNPSTSPKRTHTQHCETVPAHLYTFSPKRRKPNDAGEMSPMDVTTDLSKLCMDCQPDPNHTVAPVQQ